MMNITVTLTAAPELLVALLELSDALKGKGKVESAAKGQGQQMVGGSAVSEVAPQQPIQAALSPIIPTSAPAVVPVTPPVNTPTTSQAPAQAPTGQIPTAVQTYSMEQLAVAATQLVDAGRRQELVSLLISFGIQALTALPKEQYGNFATQLRAMGAKI